MAVDPRGSDLKAFLAEAPDEPVVMLNLLRYAGEAGRASYDEYARRLAAYLPKVGGEVIYAGGGAPADHAVAVTRTPGSGLRRPAYARAVRPA